MIDVYVHPNLHENLEHNVTGQKWTSQELNWAVERWLIAFQENLPASYPPLRFAGESSVPYNQSMGAGTVHISPWLASEPTCSGYPNGLTYGSPASGVVIEVKRSSTGFVDGVNQNLDPCNRPWDHYDPPSTFRGLLNHELMHNFGTKHDGCVTVLSCNTQFGCSCSDFGASDIASSWNCHRHDYETVRDNHGPWSSGGPGQAHRESFNGTTWTNLAAPPAYGPGAGLSSSSLPYLFRAERRHDGAAPIGSLRRWVFTTQAWEYWGFMGDSNAMVLGSIDVAYGGTPAYPFVVHMSTNSASDPLRKLTVTRFNGVGSRTHWTLSNDLTPIDGASIAYDPASGWFMVVWRDDELAIHLTTFHPSSGFSGTFFIQDGSQAAHAIATPDVVCGDSAVGYRNCILVWADPAEDATYSKLHWFHFALNTTWGIPIVDPSPSLMTQGIVQYGGPQVAYRGPASSSTAFMLSWAEPDNDYYTIGKGSGETSFWNFGTYRTHASPTGTEGYTAPIGSAGGAYQLLRQYK